MQLSVTEPFELSAITEFAILVFPMIAAVPLANPPPPLLAVLFTIVTLRRSRAPTLTMAPPSASAEHAFALVLQLMSETPLSANVVSLIIE